MVAGLLVVVLAGCLGGGEQLEEASLDEARDELGDRVQVHGADELASEAWTELSHRVEATGHQRGEPTIGVTTDGTIWTVGEDGAAIKSSDDGQTWTVADDPVTRPKPDVDPFLWVDTDTDRVFNSRLHIAGTWLSWTDDDGDTWDLNPIAGVGTPGHDHQKLTTGPPPEDVETSGYPNLLYYVYNGAFRSLVGPSEELGGTWVAVSDDGGRTFPTEQRAHPSDCRGGIAAPATVGPEGTAYVPKHTCEGVAVAASDDGGASWERVAHLTSEGAPGWALDPMASVDDAGNVYVVWQGEDGLVYLSASTDRGDSWSKPARATPPSVGGTAFPDLVAGTEGRIAIGYLGAEADATDWDDNDPSYAPDDTVWHAYLTYVEDARQEDPTFVTEQITTEEDPVQRGCIWHHGGTNPCRNLRDFQDMVHHEGRVYFVWPDGCDACESAEDSRRLGETTVAIQEGGLGLDGEPVEPLLDG